MAGSEQQGHASQRRRSALLRREWELSLYPQAAEAGGCLVTMRSGQAAAGDPVVASPRTYVPQFETTDDFRW